MTASSEFLDFLVEHLEPLGAVSARRMFGGAGLFCDGLMFALIADDKLYLKADADNEADFIDAGLEPFLYERRDKPPVTMSYREAPEAALDDPDVLVDWARSAFGAALRADKAKRKPKRHRR